MKTIELTEDELEQATGAGINTGNGATEPTPGFRWRLRGIEPTNQ